MAILDTLVTSTLEDLLQNFNACKNLKCTFPAESQARKCFLGMLPTDILCYGTHITYCTDSQLINVKQGLIFLVETTCTEYYDKDNISLTDLIVHKRLYDWESTVCMLCWEKLPCTKVKEELMELLAAWRDEG